ncbi:hypothetical protein [Sporosarcina sp. FSL W7-1283]|uniref:hypothetical protein n=1 Tax=Sporosarcina sp. FSL W7-1283 TaxID=2921560 RepID=UPI0030F8C34B
MEEESMRPVTVVEVIVTYISLGWAFVLLTNPDIFNQSPNFSRIEAIAQSEWIVGCICLLLAAVKIIGMTLHNRRIRWFGLMLSSIFWVLMSASFLFSSDYIEFNTGFVVYSGVAVMSLWTSKEVMTGGRTD